MVGVKCQTLLLEIWALGSRLSHLGRVHGAPSGTKAYEAAWMMVGGFRVGTVNFELILCTNVLLLCTGA